MKEWEYITLSVKFNNVKGTHSERYAEKAWDWVVDFSDGSQWAGWVEILSNLGAQGWELFSVVADAESTNYDGAGSGDVKSYRVFGKRLKR
jgi:hypothetical protein